MLFFKFFFILFFLYSFIHGKNQLSDEKHIIQEPCPEIVHIVSFDPNILSTKITKANNHTKGLLETSELIKQHKIFAGINDRFSLKDRTPEEICVINKQWLATQKLPRAAVGSSKNQRNRSC